MDSAKRKSCKAFFFEVGDAAVVLFSAAHRVPPLFQSLNLVRKVAWVVESSIAAASRSRLAIRIERDIGIWLSFGRAEGAAAACAEDVECCGSGPLLSHRNSLAAAGWFLGFDSVRGGRTTIPLGWAGYRRPRLAQRPGGIN